MKIDANILLTAKILNGEGGGAQPTGTIEITENGTHNVAQYAEAAVAVPGPEGTITITENGTHDVAQYAEAKVNVSGGGGDGKLIGLLEGGDAEEFTLAGVMTLRPYAMASSNYVRISLPDVANVGQAAFNGCRKLETLSLPRADTICSGAFISCVAMKSIDLGSSLRQIQSTAFGNQFASNSATPVVLRFPASIQIIQSNAVVSNANVSEIRFVGSGTPHNLNASAFGGNTKITDIYVPWSEGTVAGAPWGATNATVHYDTVYDENGDPVI